MIRIISASRGCILFSQYCDTVRWVGEQLAKHPDIPSDLTIGLYAGSNRSGFRLGGRFRRCERTLLKNRVLSGEIKLLLGIDAASESLNLQLLGTLINMDLPWNPTCLEKRKRRIQRIGQARNPRYPLRRVGEGGPQRRRRDRRAD